MRRLRLIGLSGDGRDVLFMDDANVECAAPADERLRAALRGDRARLGQLEIEMESALRPRDIQSRIRSGQTPESVAALAQVSVERIMPYCVPVLAERQHVAELAGRGFVRRANAEGTARKLADVVADRLRSRGLDPQSAAWDAWRRDDGRWSVQATYHSGESEHRATFVYDAVGRYSLADDDEARWLTGEKQATRKGPQPREARPVSDAAAVGIEDAGGADDESPARTSLRLAAVPSGEDLLSLSLEVDAESEPVATAEGDAVDVVDGDGDVVDGDGDVVDGDAEAEFAAEPDPSWVLDDPAEGDEPAADDEPAAVDEPSDDLTAVVRAVRETAEAPPTEHEGDGETRGRKRGGRGARRASIPSWDEIMFGRGADR